MLVAPIMEYGKISMLHEVAVSWKSELPSPGCSVNDSKCGKTQSNTVKPVWQHLQPSDTPKVSSFTVSPCPLRVTFPLMCVHTHTTISFWIFSAPQCFQLAAPHIVLKWTYLPSPASPCRRRNARELSPAGLKLRLSPDSIC